MKLKEALDKLIGFEGISVRVIYAGVLSIDGFGLYYNPYIGYIKRLDRNSIKKFMKNPQNPWNWK